MDTQCWEIFVATSSDKQTRNYDTEYLNTHHSISTLTSMWLSRSKLKVWSIYKYLPAKDRVRLPHRRSMPGPEIRFSTLCWQANLQLGRRVLKAPSLSINPKIKGIESKPHQMVSNIHKFSSKWHSQTNPYLKWCYPGQENTFLATSADNQTGNYDTEASKHHPTLSNLMPKRFSLRKMNQ